MCLIEKCCVLDESSFGADKRGGGEAELVDCSYQCCLIRPQRVVSRHRVLREPEAGTLFIADVCPRGTLRNALHRVGTP